MVRCPDGHFRRVIYSLGPYIADYPEQVLLSGIVSGWCPKSVNFRERHTLYLSQLRCTARSQDLDGDSSPRSRQWTEHLCSSFDSTQLWDEYGIVSDVTVSNLLTSPRNIQLDPFFEPFTSNFPRADIHELLSCDLLHQVIKGTFKDHLVTWVEDYLKKRHGRSAAARIMSDIDRR